MYFESFSNRFLSSKKTLVSFTLEILSANLSNISKPILEANELKLVDPIQTEKKIDEMEENIDNFLNEVDFVLSESNAKNNIEIK